MLHYEEGSECASCERYGKLEVHHLRYRWPPQREDVVLLCKECHVQWHKKYAAPIIGPIRFGTRVQVEVVQ
jgi:hypothetical protein